MSIEWVDTIDETVEYLQLVAPGCAVQIRVFLQKGTQGILWSHCLMACSALIVWLPDCWVVNEPSAHLLL